MGYLDLEREWKAKGKGLKIGPGLKISNRHRAFIAEYIKTWDSTAAATAVGYKNPGEYGKKLVNGEIAPDVAEAIRRIQSKNEDKAILSSEQLVENLAKYIQSDVGSVFERGWVAVDDPNDIPKELRQFLTVESITVTDPDGMRTTTHKVKVDAANKLKAFDMLMKAQGTYAPEKHKHEHGLDWDGLFSGMSQQPDDQAVIDAKMKELEG